MKNLKHKALNAIATGVQGTTGFMHSSLFYAIKGVEQLEIGIIKPITGSLPKDIRNDRRLKTISLHKKHAELVQVAKEKLNEFAKTTHVRSMSLIHEVQTFNRSTEIITDEQ